MDTRWQSTPLRPNEPSDQRPPEDGDACTLRLFAAGDRARHVSECEWSSIGKAETCTLSHPTTMDAATTTESPETDSLERMSSDVYLPDVSIGGKAFETRHYRRRLTARLVCAFCVLLLVAIAVCLACVAMLLHVEPPRGVLVAVEGSLEMAPNNSNYCVVGTPAAISAYKLDTVKSLENKLDSIYGNKTVASRYSGSLVEDFRCLLRPGHEGVRIQVDFTLFWRRRRNRYGVLSPYPSTDDVADALHEALTLSDGWLAGFQVDLYSIIVGDSRTIA
uniref:SEA domain-containing protein n=1 Tax=Rhipicephalus microplus TaxID=6941 RepID=A0A6M2D805_RHIMP